MFVFSRQLRNWKGRRRTVPISSKEESIPEDVQDEIEHMRQLERLDAAIEALPPKCKEVFCRVYLNEQKYEEVAEQLHISFHTVKAHINMAFQLLRKEFLILFFYVRNVKFQVSAEKSAKNV